MSEEQAPTLEEATDLSTRPETLAKSKTKRSTPTNKKQPSLEKETALSNDLEKAATTPKSRSRSKRAPSAATTDDKKPERRRRPKPDKTEEPGTAATIEPQAQEIGEAIARTEQPKKATVSRKRAGGSRKKQKEPEPGGPPVEREPEVLPFETDLGSTPVRLKAVLVPPSKPELETLEPELATPAANGAHASIEVEPPETVLDTPLADDGMNGARVSIEVEPPETALDTPLADGGMNGARASIEVESEVSPLEPDMDVTLPRIKAVTIPVVEAEPEIPPPLPVEPQPVQPRRIARKVLAGLLLVVLIGSFLWLWHDVTDTHLYLYALDAGLGQTLAQEDLGGGYQGNTTITNPVQVSSSLAFGVQTGQAKQELIFLTGSDISRYRATRFSAPLTHGTLSVTPDKDLIVEYANGLQVMTSDGRVLWQMQGDEPALGTRPFQPAFDGSTLYTIKSARSGVIAAYDLQSGATLWTKQLDDTFEYAAPFVLNGNTLYIAADHTIYALNRADGTLLWKVASLSRALLALNEGQPLLVAAGANGLVALKASTGKIAWSFNGQPRTLQASTNESLTPAQFYQAGIDSTNNVMYATGIVWDAQQVQEQLWLFAVDATTGEARWSERIASGFTSADAGRIYPPLVDTTHGLVILQQAEDDGNHLITAYNTADGAQRWSLQLEGVTAAAPSLLQVSSDTVILLGTQSSSTTALQSWSLLRILLISGMGLSVLWLLLLWILPIRAGKPRSTLRNLPHYMIYPLKLVLRFWRYSHKLFALAFLVILVCGGGLAYAQLASPQSYLNQFATSDGHIQWQHSTGGSAAQLAMADAQGSIAITSAGKSLHQLTSLDLNGVSRWTSFPSEGTFSLPTVSTQPGTVLVALSGHISLPYQFAPDDPAYAHPLDFLYMLYLLDRQTGRTIWQNMIVPPGEQQDTAVLGADAKFIYVASRATSTFIPGIEPVVQLIAVNKTTGIIEWRIFGPHEPASAGADFGSLLLRGRSTIWQVANTVYALDTVLGQIQWSRSIADINPYEEAQMAETEGVLLVERSDVYHALDPATGNERWTIANPGIDAFQTPGGIVAANNIFLIYGGGALLAIDPTNRHIIWSQKQLEAIQSLKVSDDNTTVYAIMLSHITGSPATQVLAALDVQTGAIRWTFQASEQESFIHGFQYSQNTLYATVCLSGNQASCGHEILYAINATTGAAGWKFEANSIYNVRVSLDSSTVVFQTNNSAWGNLIEHFKT